ncbi:MAG: HAD family hydrolase [Candidatus Omnitrophota bacterium]
MDTIEVVIFDLDGTLVNAYAAITKSFNFVMKKMGYPQKKNGIIKKAVGWGDKKLLEPFVSDRDFEKALKMYRQHHVKSLKEYAKIKKTNLKLLKILKEKGIKLAIATNRPSKFSKILLKSLKIDKFFDFMLCGDEVKNGKPHPEMLMKILKHFKVNNKQAIYVGDMTIDAIAGKRAGINTVIVLGGSSIKAEIKKVKPFKVIEDIKGLPKIINI